MAGARSWLISVNIEVGWHATCGDIAAGWHATPTLSTVAPVTGGKPLSEPAEHPGFSQEVTLRLSTVGWAVSVGLVPGTAPQYRRRVIGSFDGTGTWDGAEQRREGNTRSAGVGSPPGVRRCPGRGRGHARPGFQRVAWPVPGRTLR